MCGRFSLISSEELIRRIFRLNRAPLRSRYNIAPSQDAPVIHIKYETGEREWTAMRWGLIPPWAKDISFGSRAINAQGETLFEKPAFRQAAKKRRALIPTNGFFEWEKKGNSKQPYYIYLRDQQPFAFAGLWESWQGDSETPMLSFTIITTQANELMAPIHSRMPVILSPADYERWLDPENQSSDNLAPLLHPYPPDEMALHPVGATVNNARNDVPACIEPIALPNMEDLLF
jgi:putative SOS response-associated peptidase YedK